MSDEHTHAWLDEREPDYDRPSLWDERDDAPEYNPMDDERDYEEEAANQRLLDNPDPEPDEERESCAYCGKPGGVSVYKAITHCSRSECLLALERDTREHDEPDEEYQAFLHRPENERAMLTEIHFSDHAAWRTAERHGTSVCLDVLALEIAAALAGGWVVAAPSGMDDLTVVIRTGESFIVRPCDNGAVVVTALG